MSRRTWHFAYGERDRLMRAYRRPHFHLENGVWHFAYGERDRLMRAYWTETLPAIAFVMYLNARDDA